MCAMHWGNGDFESIRPEGSLVTATFLHDIGWQEFDQRPRLKTDEKTGNPTPVNFHELSPQTWVEMYEQGIETVARIDPYAGLVVSLHGVGLQNRRYGLTPEWSEPTSEFDGFIQREQKRQRQLIEQISEQDDLSISAEERTTLERLQEDNYNPEHMRDNFGVIINCSRYGIRYPTYCVRRLIQQERHQLRTFQSQRALTSPFRSTQKRRTHIESIPTRFKPTH